MVDFTLSFPAGFLWGTATAAHQVEGQNSNNWSDWEDDTRHFFGGQQAGLACDWWGGRYREDFDRAADLHTNAHRFSIEWSRIQPERTRYDSAALDHYVQMVSALHERGIEPMITLHHFTNPLWIENDGGWTNPDTVRRFEQFVRMVVDELGHAVKLWCTINEPMIYTTQSFLIGRWPPGQRNMGQAYTVAANLLRAHAAAYYAIKEAQPDAQVGPAKNLLSFIPRYPAPVNLPALRMMRQLVNRAWVEALVTGSLRFPFRTISVPEARDTLDWIGLNYYYRYVIGLNLLRPRQFFVERSQRRDGIQGPGDVGEIWPEGLFEHIKWLHKTLDKPIIITENGVPDPDDTIRPLHMVRSVRSVWQAINFNYPVKGYFYWSLLDNFEWVEAYDPRFRFGLYACDPKTQARTPRRSAELYGEICAANGLTGDMARRYMPDQAEDLFPGVAVQDSVPLPPPKTVW